MRARLTLSTVILFALFASAQTTVPPQVTLTWVAPTTSPTPTGYNVYRYSTVCPAQISTSTATKLTSTPLTALTYIDTAVTRGSTYCYFVTSVSVSNSVTNESGASGASQVVIPIYLARNTPDPPPGSPLVQSQ